MTLRLYEIPDMIRGIIDRAVDPETGEIDAALELELEGWQEEFERKAEYIALLAREASAEAVAWRTEADRLAGHQRSCENRAARLKAYLLGCMARAGVARIDGKAAKIRLQDSPPSIRWTRDVNELPEAYRRVTIAPDLARVRDEWKAGGELPEGFEAVQGTHVRIT